MERIEPEPPPRLELGWKGLAMIVFVLAVLTALFAPRIDVVDPQPVFQEIVNRR